MNILTVHNRYQIRGGEDESREAEKRLLDKMGHHVETYEQDNDWISQINPVHLGLKTIWSRTTYRQVRETLRSKKFDIVHVQNFFPLISPSVYYAAKSEGVPVVQTLRNYRLLCPNGLFFRDGQVCEDCMGKLIPLPGVIHGCYRDSYPASIAVAAMLTAHRTMQTWTKMIDVYIALTEFTKQKFIAGGFPAEKIIVKPNFVYPDPGIGQGSGEYALFVGRLSVEKGLDTLLAAWKLLGKKVPLKIVGDGPLASQVASLTERLPQVEWLGRKSIQEVHALIGEAKLVIFPSKWYETFGRVAVEAFAKGTPVIAANIGAIAEIVEHKRTGLHFEPGNAIDLANQIEWALQHESELAQMRYAVRAEFEAKYTAQENYQQLMKIYSKVKIECH